MSLEISKIGKRGAFIIPAALRKRFGVREGDLIIAQETSEGILLRPATAVPTEIYTPQRIAEFLLNNAVDEEDYLNAVKEVKKLGIDPETVLQDVPWRTSNRHKK